MDEEQYGEFSPIKKDESSRSTREGGPSDGGERRGADESYSLKHLAFAERRNRVKRAENETKQREVITKLLLWMASLSGVAGILLSPHTVYVAIENQVAVTWPSVAAFSLLLIFCFACLVLAVIVSGISGWLFGLFNG